MPKYATYGIFSHWSIGIARQPPKSTVMITMRMVVEKNICLTSVLVLRIEREKAIAPRRPQNTSRCCLFQPMRPFSSGSLVSLVSAAGSLTGVEMEVVE